METRNPVSTANIGDHPLHPMLIPFPIAFLVATFVCDLAFWWTRTPGWATGALWLLGAALIMAALAAAAGVTDFLGDKRIRDLSAAWHHMIGNVIAVLLSLWNWYLRYSGGEAAVLPWALCSRSSSSPFCSTPDGAAGRWSTSRRSPSSIRRAAPRPRRTPWKAAATL
jgi:uncharacterized membrane protein